MKYPKDVLTKTRNGKTEARIFIDSGIFVRYGYIDIKNEKEERKTKIYLHSKKGVEGFFLIPMKDGKRFILIKDTDKKWEDIKILKNGKSISLKSLL